MMLSNLKGSRYIHFTTVRRSKRQQDFVVQKKDKKMAISRAPSARTKSVQYSVLYTPCHCPVGQAQQQQQHEVGKSTRKSYKTSRRIQYLARPRKPHRRYYQPQLPLRRFATHTEISRPDEEPYASKRLQQLALPHVRKLVAAQEEYRRFIARSHQEQIEKRIKKSIFTVYSRLANVQLPKLDELRGMTPEEWQKHRDWLVRNAQPKKVPAPELPKRDRKPLAALLNRIEELAVAKEPRAKVTGKEKPVPAVSPAALKAQASERVKKLAQPIQREEPKVKTESIREVAYGRIFELAEPKRYKNVLNEYRDNPFTVEPKALKAKASDRVLELAKPKKVKK